MITITLLHIFHSVPHPLIFALKIFATKKSLAVFPYQNGILKGAARGPAEDENQPRGFFFSQDAQTLNPTAMENAAS
jgi:hypothetical protein